MQQPLLPRHSNGTLPGVQRQKPSWHKRLASVFSQFVREESESLDYDPVQNRVNQLRLLEEPERRKFYGYTGHTLAKFFVTLATGVLTGLTAAGVAGGLELVFHTKHRLVQHVLDSYADQEKVGFLKAWGLHLGISSGLVLFAACLVQFWAPTAAGGGVSLVMAFLNGNDVPNLLRRRTLFTKFIGTICGCGANLAVGPEGSMVHMGAAIASVVSFWNLGSCWRTFRDTCKHLVCICCGRDKDGLQYRRMKDTTAAPFYTDTDHREFVSAGTSAGIAAAFGAPVGGVLYSMEEACTHWSRKVAWRCFLASAMATFVLAQLHPKQYAGMLSFDASRSQMHNRDWLFQLPLLALTSIAAGALGAFFNLLRKWLWPTRASRCRPGLRLLEVAALVLVTITTMFLAARYLGRCVQVPEDWAEDHYGFRFTCPQGEYNDLATALLSVPADTIRHIFSVSGGIEGRSAYHLCSHTHPCSFTAQSLAIQSALYLVLMALASGVAVPGGLFMPSIMVGASFGAAVGIVLMNYLPGSWNIQPGVYAVVAGTAVLAAVFRSSISLVVIVVEGTRGIDFIFGIIIAVVCANWVAVLIHPDGVYESELERDGNICFLRAEPPHRLHYRTAEQIMSPHVLGFSPVERVDNVVTALRNTKHNGFPVVAPRSDCTDQLAEGRLEGLITRAQLLVLLQNQLFTDANGKLLSGEQPSSQLQMQLDAEMRSYYRRRYKHRRALASRPEVIDDLPLTEQGGAEDRDADGDAAQNGVTSPARLRPSLSEAVLLTEEATHLYLDLTPFMHTAPITVRPQTNGARVHQILQSMGLRHVLVTDSSNCVVGIITRKDLDRAAGQGPWRKNPIPEHSGPWTAGEVFGQAMRRIASVPGSIAKSLAGRPPRSRPPSTAGDPVSPALSARSSPAVARHFDLGG